MLSFICSNCTLNDKQKSYKIVFIHMRSQSSEISGGICMSEIRELHTYNRVNDIENVILSCNTENSTAAHFPTFSVGYSLGFLKYLMV